MSYFMDNVDKKVLYVEYSTDEVVREIQNDSYDYVLFSLMNANQKAIEKIVISCPSQCFMIGGYNEDYLNKLSRLYQNTVITKTTEGVAKKLGLTYRFGTDYSLFKGDTVIPRLTMSYGCLNNCKFCIVPHGKIVDVERSYIEQQVDSFNDLDCKLIYIDDKTFGQSKNFSFTSDMAERINRTDFNGFVVQTTTGMVVSKANEFVRNKVSVVEIGLETYNDHILKAYNKPSSNKLVDECVKAACDSGLMLIANIIIGLSEETDDTYKRTFDYLMPLLEDGQLIGINSAIYTDYDDSENLGEIDFKETENTDLHRKWWNIFNNTAAEILRRGGRVV